MLSGSHAPPPSYSCNFKGSMNIPALEVGVRLVHNMPGCLPPLIFLPNICFYILSFDMSTMFFPTSVKTCFSVSQIESANIS